MNSSQIYLFSFILLSLAIILFLYLQRRTYELCELSKDPFIFGTEACHYLIGDDQDILSIDLFSLLFSIISHKTILRGISDESSFIIKQLSYPSDTQVFDDLVKTPSFYPEGLNDNHLVEILYVPLNSEVDYKLRICPDIHSARKFVTLASLKWNNSIPSIISRWTLLKLNPEPLLLSLLSGEAWPVAEYIGSCGRLSIVEDCGERLTNLLYAPYLTRIHLSLQLVQAALKFTFSHPHFSFYLMDVSPDNIAVNPDGVLKFIDLEHVIVVDRSDINTGRENHTSVHVPCDNCFSFYPVDICTSAFSDHNIYAICKEIFSSTTVFPKGFLYDASPGLASLLLDCLTASSDTRFNIILHLKRRLQNILASL